MPPRRRPCQVCAINESKYTCPQCPTMYCSVSCFKTHRSSSCSSEAFAPSSVKQESVTEETRKPQISLEDESLAEPKPLRPLTSLNWPYVPEQSAYPDPLERDDPKPLQLRHYEAIATSPAIRRVLASNPNLPAILTSIDQLKGTDRDRALQRALGVTAPEIIDPSKSVQLDEDTLALRALAEAVEAAVRGDRDDALGLDWDG